VGTGLRTLVELNQIRNSRDYDDTLAAGSDRETLAAVLDDDHNAIFSMLNRLTDATGAGNWFDGPPLVNAKLRGLKQLNTDLDSFEERPVLFPQQKVVDVAVPAAAAATGVLSFGANPSDTQTVTIGSKVYTFQTVLTDVDGNVLIGATASDSLDNLIAAITLGAGSGTLYAASTTLHPTVTAAAGAGDTMDATAKTAGTAGNAIATSTTVGSATWTNGATLTGGAGDVAILSGTAKPSEVAAVGAVDTAGAVVAAHSGTFGEHTLDLVTGPSAVEPYNLCLVHDVSTGEVIESAGKDVLALLVSENATNGHTFSDTTPSRVMLSFVRENATSSALEAVPAADVGGHTIHFVYVRQIPMDSVPRYAWLQRHFIDGGTPADVTLNNAIDNQVGIATQVQDIDWDIADTRVLAFTADAGVKDLLRLAPTAGGDTIELNIDTLDVNNSLDADFSQGVKVDTADTPIHIGVNAGVIESTGSDNLELQSAGTLYFDDGFRAGSSWANPIAFSASSAELSALETIYGSEASIASMLAQAMTGAGRNRAYAYNDSGAAITAGTNVAYDGGAGNISAPLPDMSAAGVWPDRVDVYVNGEYLEFGASEDFYAGDSLADGELRFTFPLLPNAKIAVVVWGPDLFA